MKAQELFERVQTEMANGKSYEKAWQMANTWSDAARKAALESRKRHGLEGAKFQDHPDYFKK